MTDWTVSRRLVLAGSGALAATPAWAQGTVRRGGTLQVAYNTEQRNLNSAMVASNAVFLVASKIIEPLAEMTYDGSGLSPRLATGWEASADGLSVTFQLRRGVKWHDGRDFTSADVQYSALEVWRRLSNFGRIVFRDLVGVDTPDTHTAVLRFSRPTPAQLIWNALPDLTAVLPRHLYEGTDVAQNPRNQAPIGTGPFRLGENRAGQFVVLDRNPDYWDSPKPYLDRIVFRVMPDKGAIAAAHEAGELQLSCFSSVPLADLKRLAGVPALEVVNRGYEGSTYHALIELNLRNPILADVRVRRAIHHALDLPRVVRDVFDGHGTVGTGPVPTTSRLFYTADTPRYGFDVARANALLDEAGHRRGANGMRFSLKLVPAPWFDYTVLLGEYLRQALRQVGIDCQPQRFDAPGHLQAIYRDHQFDIATGSPVFRNDPAISTTILYRTGTPPGVPWSNQYGYASQAMDQLLDQAAGELDPARRVAHYHRFQQLAMEDLPVIPAVEFTFLTVASRRLRNHSNLPRWAMSNWADLWLDS
ncbi:MAG: ABC transporter substrate-binding protein [Alphaproteobacteria bacterium]|nr:ABC transporter substrate-binding protein [Alphaproteobacteria bacterium]TAD89738.1 MAG: ABC transporter substrate-binding protein [Alphaproteobacteria bacterium]